MLLRPLAKYSKGKLNELEENVQAELKSNPFCSVEGYRLVHLGITTSAVQEAALAHQRKHPSCSGLLIALADFEIKRGGGQELKKFLDALFVTTRVLGKPYLRKYLNRSPGEILAK